MNPRLSAERAAFLAEHVGCPTADGGYQMACDPWHKIPSPHPYRIEEAVASWQRITAPVLQLNAEHGFVQQRFGRDTPTFWARASKIPQLQVEWIANASHNLQHDQPEVVAGAIEAFILKLRSQRA
jgi:pimeloyl-ACP methyl ester carboxylesterase